MYVSYTWIHYTLNTLIKLTFTKNFTFWAFLFIEIINFQRTIHKKRQIFKKSFIDFLILIELIRELETLHQGTVISGLQLFDVVPMRPSPVSRQCSHSSKVHNDTCLKYTNTYIHNTHTYIHIYIYLYI